MKIAAIVTLGLVNTTLGCSPSTQDRPADFYISNAQLNKEDDSLNDLKMKRKYHGKVIRLSGKIYRIQTTTGKIWIQLGDRKEGITNCIASPDHEEEIVKYEEGDKIIVKGVYEHSTLGGKLVNCVVAK